MVDQSTSSPIAVQQSFWNEWNSSHREASISGISKDQRAVVLHWLAAAGRPNLDIVEVGCGAGWLCASLLPFGRVTATDLSDEVLARASARTPEVNFVAGDFMSLDLGAGAYDVVISLEVLSHVADQPAFIGKLASLLREGGLLMLATQNRPALEPLNLAPPKPGQLRRWVDRQELSALLAPEFETQELFSVTPVNVQVRKLRRLASYIPGAGVELLKVGGRGGWTLMALARKRGGQRHAG